MSFIKPLPRHWNPTDFELSIVSISEPVRHIAKTVCLLESRCDDYAEYLRSLFQGRGIAWNVAIDQWNSEECQHGELLRILCETVDPDFQFNDHMARYTSLVSYHAPTGISVRGSVAAELVSRCVVEALASTLYRVLADSTDHGDIRKVFSALGQDEARHFGMFLKMLDAEAATVGGPGSVVRCWHAFRRMVDLEDSQIMVASCIVARRGDAPIHLRREANWYLARLYGLYRWKHLRYAVRMLLHTVKMRPVLFMPHLCTFVLWTGIRIRWIWARFLSRRLPLVLNPHPGGSRSKNC
jgi:hypothetical protein